MNPLSIFLYLVLSVLSINTIFSANIYQWRDKDNIRQFTTIPPPLSCKTPSCLKINREISEQIKKKNSLLLKQEDNDIKNSTVKKAHDSDTTYLDKATIMCDSLNNIKEYTNIEQARKYLRRDQICVQRNNLTEYTIIEKQDDFSVIRIYLHDGSSEEKWVKNDVLFEVK